jgi:hypothetical protein
MILNIILKIITIKISYKNSINIEKNNNKYI